MFIGFVSMISVLISALIGCGVPKFFLDGKSARVAGFAFSIGSLTGQAHLNDTATTQLSASMGVIAGLLLVWFLFFKQNVFATDQESEKSRAK